MCQLHSSFATGHLFSYDPGLQILPLVLDYSISLQFASAILPLTERNFFAELKLYSLPILEFCTASLKNASSSIN